MPAAPQGGGGGGQDNTYDILWTIAAIAAVCAALWYLFRGNISGIYLSIKLCEVYILSFFGKITGHSDYFNPLYQSIVEARQQASTIEFNNLLTKGASVGVWLRIPLAILFFFLAVIVYISSSTRVYKATYKMQDFVKLESKNWPQITPVVGLDLIKTDIDTGPWAMALTPMQFCKRYKLLQEVRPLRQEGMSRKEWDKIEVVLKRGEANKLFAMQLGPLWTSAEKLPPHLKALFAVFAARINADTKPAMELLARISASSDGKLNFSGTEELLKKHANTKLVQAIVKNHAYVATVMASMLLGCRDDGVQASADFLWLKPVDRRIWYTLNTVGRQTPFIEIAGIFAHWIAEREAGRKLMVPMVEEATKAVELALKEIVYQPDESSDNLSPDAK
jgi:intracellular multiplication protein IcmP